MKKILKLTFIILLMFPLNIISQNKLEGIYALPSPTGDYSESITFHKSGIFDYESSAHLGVEKYGTGIYTLNRKELILNYNLTKPLIQSFYKSEFWINDKEVVELILNVKDLEGESVSFANIYILANGKGVVANENGYGNLILEKEKQKAELTISFVGYQELKIKFNQNYNYKFDIKLRKLDIGSAPEPILNQVDTLEILKRNGKQIITFDQKKQKQIWTKFE